MYYVDKMKKWKECMERIRERVFDYHIDEGVFVIDSIDSEKTEYRIVRNLFLLTQV